MKLYTFEHQGSLKLGAERDGRLVDLSAAGIAPDMLAFIRGGEAALSAARRALADPASPSVALSEARPRAPLRPGKILCSGINYRSHAQENPNAVMPTEPFFFSKVPSAVVGPGEAIILPSVSKQVDYEIEFAVVVGRTMRRTPAADVLAHLAGYTLLHDVSARDVQFKDNQITLGKNFDTFAPLGPCVVTPDELPEPGQVPLRTTLNGQVMQDGSTADWLFPLPTLLSFLSHRMTLEPGDVVTTGTPAGVGAFRKPPLFLKDGDVVSLEAEGIGRMENPVRAEA